MALTPLPAISLPVSYFTGTATIERNTATSDGAGGHRPNWSTLATVGCRLLSPRQPSEQVTAGAVRARLQWRCEVPLGTDLKPTDRLVINGTRYQVTETDAGMTGALLLTAYVERG